MEIDLQNKVRSLNEHQNRVDKMEEELLEMAEKQKQMLNLEVRKFKSNSACNYLYPRIEHYREKTTV